MLKENVHEMSWIETSIADLCVDGFKGKSVNDTVFRKNINAKSRDVFLIIGLLSMKIEDDSQKIKEGVLGFARELISGIISHEKRNHVR